MSISHKNQGDVDYPSTTSVLTNRDSPSLRQRKSPSPRNKMMPALTPSADGPQEREVSPSDSKVSQTAAFSSPPRLDQVTITPTMIAPSPPFGLSPAEFETSSISAANTSVKEAKRRGSSNSAGKQDVADSSGLDRSKPEVHLDKFQNVSMLGSEDGFDDLDLEDPQIQLQVLADAEEQSPVDSELEEEEEEMREVPRRIDCSWLLAWAIGLAQWCHRKLVCSRPKFLQMVRELDTIPEDEFSGARRGWLRVYVVVFESSTIAGQIFDVTIICLIVASVLTVVFDSVESYRNDFGPLMLSLEGIFTFLFTVEYLVRLVCIKSPVEYALSYLGIVDFLSIAPSYLSMMGFFQWGKYAMVLRVVRVLRVFRVLKLVNYVNEFSSMTAHLKANQKRVFIFLFWICCLVCIIGCLMYIIEGGHHGFSSIPESVYWAVVTITTVGYGDIYPKTSLGQFIASLVMLFGYGIIACPFVLYGTDKHEQYSKNPLRKCAQCRKSGHQIDARYCRLCGFPLQDSHGIIVSHTGHYEAANTETPKDAFASPRATTPRGLIPASYGYAYSGGHPKLHPQYSQTPRGLGPHGRRKSQQGFGGDMPSISPPSITLLQAAPRRPASTTASDIRPIAIPKFEESKRDVA